MKSDREKLKDTLIFINLEIDELRVMLNCIVKLMTFFSERMERDIYELGILTPKEGREIK
uniref:Uncharacterized protein n=1 Tax=viral metagenome TaxID=1070528 RepID=A0A6H1ZNI2_9ZZZZ